MLCSNASKAALRPDYIRFSLGESCREDFLEILFLAANGYGAAALKLLRGLYERAVALSYMVKEPTKTERFAHFAAIQEHNALKDGLKITTEEHWNAIMRPENAASKVRDRLEAVKEKFEQTDCKKCKTKRLAITWDLDVASMVAKVGAPYAQYYFMAYTHANLQIHATLASALREDNKEPDARREQRRLQADTALFCATMLMIEVIREQNTLFGLELGGEVQSVQDAMANVWQASINARKGRHCWSRNHIEWYNSHISNAIQLRPSQEPASQGKPAARDQLRGGTGVIFPPLLPGPKVGGTRIILCDRLGWQSVVLPDLRGSAG